MEGETHMVVVLDFRGAKQAAVGRPVLASPPFPAPASRSLSCGSSSLQTDLCRHRHGRHVGEDDDDQVLHPDPGREASWDEDDAADLKEGAERLLQSRCCSW